MSGQPPVDLLDCRGLEGLVKRRSILSLTAVLNHPGHAFLIKRTFKKNRFDILNQPGQRLLETVRREVGGAYEEGSGPSLLDFPYGL